MAKSSTDFLSLIELCSELELNANLNVLRTDFECSDEKVSWLPLLAIQLDSYAIETFNLYEKIQMLLGIRKLVPKILKLNADLTIAVKSTENLCPNYKFNFNINLVQNLLTHRSSCATCMFQTNLAKPIEIQALQPTVSNSAIEWQYLPQMSYETCSFPTVSVEKPIEKATRKTRRTKRKSTGFTDEIDREPVLTQNETKPIQNETIRIKSERKILNAYSKWHNQLISTKSSTFPSRNESKTEKGTRRTEKVTTKPENQTISNTEIEKCYPPHILSYVRSLDKSDVVTVRLNPDGKLECLLCSSKIPVESYLQFNIHMSGKKHLKNVRREAKSLVEFHKFWRHQTEEIWKCQFQFGYIANGVRCKLCDQHMHLKDVLQHLEMCSEALSDEQPRGPYSMATERLLFRNVPFIQLGENFYPVFQRKNGNVHCLICNVVVGEDQQAHVESPEHLVLQDSERVQFSLRSYHDVWSSLTELTQRRQTYFVRGMEKMTCTLCDVQIEYKLGDLNEHLSSQQHKQLLRARKEQSRDDHMEGTTKPKFPNQAHWFLFKDVPFVKIGDDSYPTYQRHATKTGIGYICMVCNDAIPSQIEKDRHTAKKTHRHRLAKKTVQESLVKYHKTWNALPTLMQFKQSQFERCAIQMRCTLCRDKYIDYDTEALREHLNTKKHLSKHQWKSQQEKMKAKDGGAPNKPEKQPYPPKRNQTISESDSSDIVFESPRHEQDDLMVISDDDKPELNAWGNEPVEKKFKTEGESTAVTFNFKQESQQPGYLYYDYYEPKFIPVTKTNPKEASQFVLSPKTVKTEPSCSYNGTNLVNRFHQQINGRSSSEHDHVKR